MIQRIGLVLLILCLFGCAVAAPGAAQEGPTGHEVAEEVEDEETVYEHQISRNVRVVDYEWDEATVTIVFESDRDDASAVITDASRKIEGVFDIKEESVTLTEGQTEVTFVTEGGGQAVTVRADGQLVGVGAESDTNFLPTVAYPIIAFLGGGVLTLLLILGLDQLANRKSATANNPIE